MASIPSQTPAPEVGSPWNVGFRKVVNARWTFVGLQALDLLATLLAFRIGGMEVNPIVAHFTVIFGRARGLLISKLIAVALAMGVRRLLWVVNIFYAGIVFWNVIVLLTLR